jgi:CDP-glycerol glycerophosphotransferase
VTKEYPKSTIDKIKLWDVGYPKYDLNFKNEDSQIEEIRKSIGLDPSKKTILFAPAWDPKGVLRTHGLKLLNLFENLKQYNFIIKLHPATLASKKSKHYDFYTGGLDWRKEIADFMDKSKSNNLFFPVIESINPLFKISDLLITDFSGVSLGFCLEDKPIICLDCHDFHETLSKWGSDPNQSFENNLFNNGREAATIVKNLEELYNTVKTVISNPEEKAVEREQIRTRLLYNRGQGSLSFLSVMNFILQH